jgi:radical SAM protein with 4Fe4S-binding SPASM domain
MGSAKPTVYFQSTINEDNVEEIPAIAELAKFIAVDQVVFSNQTESRKRTYEQFRLKTDVSERLRGKEKESAKDRSPSCGTLRRCYITYAGKVLPCNILMMLVPRREYSEFEFGDITLNSLRSIWFSKRYRKFRVLQARGSYFHFCNGCPNINAEPVEDLIISCR